MTDADTVRDASAKDRARRTGEVLARLVGMEERLASQGGPVPEALREQIAHYEGRITAALDAVKGGHQ